MLQAGLPGNYDIFEGHLYLDCTFLVNEFFLIGNYFTLTQWNLRYKNKLNLSTFSLTETRNTALFLKNSR